MENTPKVFSRIRGICKKYLIVHEEYKVWKIRRKYLIEYGENAERILPYYPKTPRDIKLSLSRRFFSENQKYLRSWIFYIDRIEWAKNHPWLAICGVSPRTILGWQLYPVFFITFLQNLFRTRVFSLYAIVSSKYRKR